MKERMRKLSALIGTVALITASVAGCGGNDADSGSSPDSGKGSESASGAGSSTEVVELDTADMFTSRDKEVGYDESDSQTITLSDSGSKTDADDVKVDGSTITISKEGVYVLTGKLSDGQIRVETDDTAKVQLVLKNAEIINDDSAAIYVVQADKVFVTTDKDTDNKLSVTGTFIADGETDVDGVIFSKSDMTLNGQGTLTVDSANGHGVVSKDDLKITSGEYKVTAKNHGFAGKDSVRIAGGKMDITCQEDGIHSDNTDDTAKGYVYIADGVASISSGDDAIHGSSYVVIDDGTINITKSYEGIEGQNITVNGGTIDMVSSDDGFNASSGGSGTDANDFAAGNKQSADGTENAGDKPQMSTEGGDMPQRPTEGGDKPQRPTEGDMPQQSAENGQNGQTRGGKGGPGGGGGSMAGDSSCWLKINGGKIHVNAGGDGLDSNGLLLVTGGETYVSGPTNNGNGALDSGTEATVTGGTLIAAGASGMAENFGDNSTQCSMLVTFDNMENAGTITLKDSSGKELLSYEAEKSYNSVVITCPGIKTGETYTVTCGSTENTVEMTETIYGKSSGMGGQGAMGGHGGHGGFGRKGGMEKNGGKGKQRA